MNVNEATKNAYRSDSSQKEIRLYFPEIDLSVGMDQIDYESMELTESISENESIEFIGCNASKFKITVRGISDNLKNEKIEAYILSGNTQEIPLFFGVVSDVSLSADKSHKTLKCYDNLYLLSKVDVSEWYKSIEFPKTIGWIRNNIFTYLGITQQQTILPNDEIEIEKQYSPNSLKALDVIKSICQINGVFGIINRNNVFEYRTIAKTESAIVTEEFQYQKSLKYEEYVVNPVDKLTIRQTDQDEGVSYGEGDNNYIIQGNFFTLNLDEETLQEMAENIYPNVEGFYYTPFESDNNGMPWIECGDYVSYKAYDYDNSTPGNPIYKTITFCILSRNLVGIQNLRDNYSAEGDEFQRVFITDLQSRVETIVEQVNNIVGQLEDYSLNYVVFTNPQKIIINDGDEVNTWRTSFAVQKPTQVMVNIEILFDCETTVLDDEYYDLEFEVHYYFDRVLIDTRKPKETYVDGEHILKLFYILNIQRSDIQHLFEVNLIANGGKATIEIGQGLYTLCGQKLVGDVWDGTFDFRQVIPIIELQHPTHALTIRGIVDTATVATQTPVGAELDQEIPVIVFGHPTHAITINGISETLTVATNEV